VVRASCHEGIQKRFGHANGAAPSWDDSYRLTIAFRNIVCRVCTGDDMKRHLFVGSSTEGLRQARQVCELLTDMETECVLWNTIFDPGYVTFEALESVLLKCCAAVFIATADDSSVIRGRTVSTRTKKCSRSEGSGSSRVAASCRTVPAYCSSPKTHCSSFQARKIAGTNAKTDAEALQERLAKSVKGKSLMVARDRIELSTLRFSVVCSTN
jgi:hypothetical protein